MLPGKKYTPEELLGMVWRRKWAIIIPAVLISLGTALFALTMPDRYRSETLILVVPQRVPESYVRATVTTRIEDRLQALKQQIMSRTRLELIIRDLKLYPADVARLPMEDVVERMRREVSVDIVRGDAFRISYVSDSPRKAMEVADRLQSLVRDESLTDRQALAENTHDFLQSQLEDSRQRLAEQERKVADFQRLHAGELPTERATNLQVLSNLQMQVATLNESINRDRDRRLFLERSVVEAEAEAKAVRNASQAAVPDSTGAVVPGATTAEQIERARENLRLLELRLKPGHPDVTYARRVIRELEAKLAAEEAGATPAANSGGAGRAPRPEESAVLKRAHDARQELANVESQIASKQSEERRLRDQMAQLERRVGATPAIEAEFTALTRDYETVRAGYQNLLAKHEDAKVAAALERREIGEQFKVLDRPRLPEAPFSPNRLAINLAGVLGGLGVGFGLAFLLEYRDRGVRAESDLSLVTDVPLLAVIPVILTARDRRKKRWRRLYAAAGAALFCLVMVGAALVAVKAGIVSAPQWFR